MKKIFFLLGTVLLSCALQAQTAVNIYQDCSQNGDTIDLRATGLQVIDMGLSVKWANMNIGATAPEEYGYYFAWGETMPKEDYDYHNYYYRYDFCITKYFATQCIDGLNGIVDNRNTLESIDDAAQMNWGGAWRMPTIVEWQELIDNCDWNYTIFNGVNGYLVTSNINGNQIFLPSAGRRDDELFYDTKGGFYWSSNLDETYCDYALMMSFFYWTGYAPTTDPDGYYREAYRGEGCSVRAVCP